MALDIKPVKVVSRLCLLLFAMHLLPSIVRAQTPSIAASPENPDSDALQFLNEVFERYAHARSYHLETVEENEIKGEFNRSWNKSITTAIVAPGNRYHFERRGEESWWIQISDGTTEWTYQPISGQYLQQPVPASGPSQLKSSRTLGTYQLNEAQEMLTHLLRRQDRFLSATYLPSVSIDVGGKQLNCDVIRAQGKELKGMTPGVSFQDTFWVDRENHLIRKIFGHSEGPLRAGFSDDHYVSDRTTLFTVAELGASSYPDQLFVFHPPANAIVVKAFEDPMELHLHELAGKPAPPLELTSAGGKKTSLKSLLGKPVLLDFWATWCVPCVESLPSLEKLHRETTGAGLELISIDEDENSKTATAFWIKHNEPWPNFHDSGEIEKQFPMHGIPYFVLIDSSGTIVYSDSGLDDKKLRSAVASLGPAFASVSEASLP